MALAEALAKLLAVHPHARVLLMQVTSSPHAACTHHTGKIHAKTRSIRAPQEIRGAKNPACVPDTAIGDFGTMCMQHQLGIARIELSPQILKLYPSAHFELLEIHAKL